MFKNFKKRKVLISILFFIILLIRFSLFLFPSFPTDMTDFMLWSRELSVSGPVHFYLPGESFAYFPLYMYVLWIIGLIFHGFFGKVFFTSYLFPFLIKFISTVFDLGSAYIIYKIVIKYSASWAVLAVFLYLINPAMVFDISVWGQVDSIYIFFMFYAVYCLINLKKTTAFSISSVISILIKPQAAPVLIISLIRMVKNYRFIRIIETAVIFIVMAVVIALPFFLNDPILGFFKLILNSSGVYPYTSSYAFNFWSLVVGFWRPDTYKFMGIEYATWGIIFFVFIFILLIIPQLFAIKSKDISKKHDAQFYLSLALSCLASFLFLTRMHERYLLTFFPFFLIASCIKKSKFMIYLYALLSCINFINLLYVYYYYTVIYPSGRQAVNILYLIVNRYNNIFAVLLIISFMTLFYYYLYSCYAELKKA